MFTKNIKYMVQRHLFRSIVRQKSSASNWVVPNGYDTQISMYNSLTKSKVPLVLRVPHYATWYMCGPTVYDSAHIGHACSYMKFDIIRRILNDYFNINVVLVMGITDIDDKIIQRAKERKVKIRYLTDHYETEFLEDLRRLNIRPATIICRVTDFIPQIISFIQQIIFKDQAYVVEDGSVFFDTSKFPLYGKLYPGEKETSDNSGAFGKRCNLDFALWKGVKPGEPSWPSPWGPGRPGWHIECSTMASAMLGSNVDLHSGGIDLLFPHHENEEAQSCVYHGVDHWVNYWLHTGHLSLRGGEKMSKSLKNVTSISELLARYSAREFRVFCLLSRYRNAVEFSDASMDGAVAVLAKVDSFITTAETEIRDRGRKEGAAEEGGLLEALGNARKNVRASLSDDFDTVGAMMELTNLIGIANKTMKHSSLATLAAVSNLVQETMSTFGAGFSARQADVGDARLHKVLDNVLEFRSMVREAGLRSDKGLLKNCDDLRDNLAAVGINIKDVSKDKSSWSFNEAKVKF